MSNILKKLRKQQKTEPSYIAKQLFGDRKNTYNVGSIFDIHRKTGKKPEEVTMAAINKFRFPHRELMITGTIGPDVSLYLDILGDGIAWLNVINKEYKKTVLNFAITVSENFDVTVDNTAKKITTKGIQKIPADKEWAKTQVFHLLLGLVLLLERDTTPVVSGTSTAKPSISHPAPVEKVIQISHITTVSGTNNRPTGGTHIFDGRRGHWRYYRADRYRTPSGIQSIDDYGNKYWFKQWIIEVKSPTKKTYI